MFSDTDYVTSPSLSKIFPSPTIDSSPRKLYHDEIELLSDSSIAKPLTKEIELPIHKTSVEELEASVDVACRKMAKDKVLDTSFETPSLKMTKGESLIETTSRKISRDRTEVPMDIRMVLSSELDAEYPARKIERDRKGDLMDSTSKNIYRERSDLSLDARKIFWNELETSTDVTPRKISRDMMGTSTDNTSRKMIQDEHLFDSASRRIIRDSVGMSVDTVSRKLSWNKGECQLDSSVRALAMDKMVDTARAPPRKISRDELEYCTDTASLIILPRETTEVHASMEIPRQSVQREELGASESSSAPGQFGQPDLMITSQVPWKSSSDPFTVGPLSQLVYDGILEKACTSMTTTPTSLSASTPILSQNKLLPELEPPLLPPGIAFPSPAWPTETGDERSKEKEKSKKSLKLKNLFKKKNEPSPEKLQGGL